MPVRPKGSGCYCCVVPAVLAVAALVGVCLFAARWIMASL